MISTDGELGSDHKGVLTSPAARLPLAMRNMVLDPTGRARASEEPRVLFKHVFLLSDPWDQS